MSVRVHYIHLKTIADELSTFSGATIFMQVSGYVLMS